MCDDLQMPEFFGSDVEQHIPQIGIVGVLRLHKILQACRQLTRRAAELFQ
jgi:hypothetical protein